MFEFTFNCCDYDINCLQDKVTDEKVKRQIENEKYNKKEALRNRRKQ